MSKFNIINLLFPNSIHAVPRMFWME